MFIKIFQNVSKEREFLCWGLPMVNKKKGEPLLPNSNKRKNNHNNLNLTKNEFTLLKLKLRCRVLQSAAFKYCIEHNRTNQK